MPVRTQDYNDEPRNSFTGATVRRYRRVYECLRVRVHPRERMVRGLMGYCVTCMSECKYGGVWYLRVTAP
jgi:hypothetical protein